MIHKIEEIEGNNFIRNYMGDNWYPPIDRINSREYLFHDSFEWLMPVVEKIESAKRFPTFSVFIVKRVCRIHIYRSHDNSEQIVLQQADTKLEATWRAVVVFIKWHNLNNG